jgi:hypothetical protein
MPFASRTLRRVCVRLPSEMVKQGERLSQTLKEGPWGSPFTSSRYREQEEGSQFPRVHQDEDLH